MNPSRIVIIVIIDIMIFDLDLFTPLMAVCYASGQNEDSLVACAKYLLAAGSKIDAHDRLGNRSALQSHWGCIQLQRNLFPLH